MAAKNYIGMRFGTRVCIGQRPGRHARLTMICDCGRESETIAAEARKYGCVKCANVTHGHSASGVTSPTYYTWSSMKGRCNDPGHGAYRRYGARGITVCDKWMTFEGFLEDMGCRPEGTTLDRIDNALGYFKENCRWANHRQQQRNRTNNRRVTINGETRCVSEWAEVTGIPESVLWYRLTRGWAQERMLSPPRSYSK